MEKNLLNILGYKNIKELYIYKKGAKRINYQFYNTYLYLNTKKNYEAYKIKNRKKEIAKKIMKKIPLTMLKNNLIYQFKKDIENSYKKILLSGNLTENEENTLIVLKKIMFLFKDFYIFTRYNYIKNYKIEINTNDDEINEHIQANKLENIKYNYKKIENYLRDKIGNVGVYLLEDGEKIIFYKSIPSEKYKGVFLLPKKHFLEKYIINPPKIHITQEGDVVVLLDNSLLPENKFLKLLEGKKEKEEG